MTQNAKTYSNFDTIGFVHLSLFFPAVIPTGVALVVGFPRFVIERGVGYPRVGYPFASGTFRIFF